MKSPKNRVIRRCAYVSIVLFVIIIIITRLFTDAFGVPSYIITSFWDKIRIIKISDDSESELITEIDNNFSCHNINKYLSYMSLKNIKYFNNLKEVRIVSNNFSCFDDVNFLNNNNIEVLKIDMLYSKDWNSISKLKNLKRIELCDVNVSDMSLFNQLDNLSYIFILSSCQLNFNNVSSNNSVEYLEIKSALGGTPTSDISGISNYKKIKTLILFNTDVSDISELENLTNLECLYIEKNNNIKSYAPLMNIVNLKELHIENNILSEEQIAKLEEKGVEVILH